MHSARFTRISDVTCNQPLRCTSMNDCPHIQKYQCIIPHLYNYTLLLYTPAQSTCTSYTSLSARPTSPLAGSCSVEERTTALCSLTGHTNLPHVNAACSYPSCKHKHTELSRREGNQVVRVKAEFDLAQAVLLHVRELKALGLAGWKLATWWYLQCWVHLCQSAT